MQERVLKKLLITTLTLLLLPYTDVVNLIINSSCYLIGEFIKGKSHDKQHDFEQETFKGHLHTCFPRHCSAFRSLHRAMRILSHTATGKESTTYSLAPARSLRCCPN